ncbi:MAG: Gmad2 immunoglobulin-like domain-containing protein [bacterium]
MDKKLPWYRLAVFWSALALLLLIVGLAMFYSQADVQLNNPAYSWIMGVVAVIVIIIAIIYLILSWRGQQREIDYRTLFIMGICWLPVGIVMDSIILWGLGIVLVIVGLGNKKRWAQSTKWQDLPSGQRNFKKIVMIILLAMIIAGFTAYYLAAQKPQPLDQPTTEEPKVKEILIYKDLIKLETPSVESIIISPLVIKGEARGTWFFEASFPVMLTDWDGLIIAQGIATAQSNWMTEDYVPFTAELTFDRPSYGDRGALILRKDNPSGLPEYDDALEVTVFFE